MILYTDGACSRNGSPEARASWAFLEHENGEIVYEASGLVDGKQSNNTGELTAIFNSMIYAVGKNAEWAVIFSDSLYAINSISVWNVETKVKGERKMNYDLIKACQEIFINSGINFQLEWVKGHAVDAMNNHVDSLATGALKYGSHYAKLKPLKTHDSNERVLERGILICSCGREPH